MTGWRDDLPPVAPDHMLARVRDEGKRRIARRRERRRRIAVGGTVGVAALALVVSASVLSNDDDDFEDAATEAPAATEAAAAEETTAGTAAPSGTTPAATEDTDAAQVTEAPASTEPPAVPGAPIETSVDVVFEPELVWTEPADGSSCGATTVDVTYAPSDRVLRSANLVTTGPFGMAQVPMDVSANVATATVGPFPSRVIGPSSVDVFVLIIAVDVDGVVTLVQSPDAAIQLWPC